MSIAQTVKNTIVTECPSTFSLYAGCGLVAGKYVRWPAGVQLKERRNNKGRCIFAHYQYADGSELVYRYSEARENYTLTASA